MQTTIPSHQRPVHSELFVDEDTKLTDILVNAGMAKSKADAKRMISQGETWILRTDVEVADFLKTGKRLHSNYSENPEEYFIWDCLKKNFDVNYKPRFWFTSSDRVPHDLICVGGKLDTALCHRITLRPLINIFTFAENLPEDVRKILKFQKENNIGERFIL